MALTRKTVELRRRVRYYYMRWDIAGLVKSSLIYVRLIEDAEQVSRVLQQSSVLVQVYDCLAAW